MPPLPTLDPNTIPALQPPLGSVSNLINPPTHRGAVIAAVVLFMVTTTPAVIARMCTRVLVHGSVQWDDWTMVIALVGLYASSALVLEALDYGLATDEWNVSKAHVHRFGELIHDIEVVARISIFFVKLSILLLYIRYFCPPQMGRTKIYWSSVVVIVFNFLYCIALVLTVTLQCAGKHAETGQTCINSYALLLGASIINVSTDVVMLIIPIAAFWNLQMPLRRKLGLWAVFSVAGLAVASSVARLAYQIHQAKTENQTALFSNVLPLALAEHSIGMIAGCMPTFPALFRYIRRRRTEPPASEPPKARWIPALSDSFRKRNRHPMRRAPGDTELLMTRTWELGTNTGSMGRSSAGGDGVKGGIPPTPVQAPKTFRSERHKNCTISQPVIIASLATKGDIHGNDPGTRH
ncbi:hypothetical protein K491DRAFT_697686 [Lophiostoma macrostomum CBS 122681]|uniref:Rhodopsin domain-containing protein n=1 Tax=Lophiostoma macrostomum CBS 122681 TaxID=1314788 RepID=A0A6A6SSF6_9PLEO|nr:hypothetical protein K491DRAFT_697686 [Lophiostoma macrostomum CBS 122681]